MIYNNINDNKTICALATPPGISAISIIRLSGKDALHICEKIFRPINKKIKLSKVKSHTVHFGPIYDGSDLIDHVLVSVFKEPKSYTGENSVEISCHGSFYIQQKIIELLIDNGAIMAKPGEYTLRAFLNNKFDLSQAEAVADLIASDSKLSHDLALQQMKGNYSNKIKELRQKLINFASLIELELDFADEDVEFADRTKLLELLSDIKNEITYLIKSFSLGNVLKNGIPVTIIGKPNVGKSTLLNALLNEEKAITSKIPGTTRDIIEDTLIINGICFRFIDTAGLKKTTKNEIESIGIKKTYQKIEQAEIILYVFDICNTNLQELKKEINELKEKTTKKIIIIGNKIDKLVEIPIRQLPDKNFVELETIFISAKRKENINFITDSLLKSVNTKNITKDNVVVSNARHYEALSKTLKAIQNVETGINNNIYTELLDVDLRDALHYLGEITGQVTDNEILNNIFGKFCIGK